MTIRARSSMAAARNRVAQRRRASEGDRVRNGMTSSGRRLDMNAGAAAPSREETREDVAAYEESARRDNHADR